MSDCTCGRIAIGMKVTENRNWHVDCPSHGLKSEWYSSPEQVAKRKESRDRLLSRYAAAKAAREARG